MRVSGDEESEDVKRAKRIGGGRVKCKVQENACPYTRDTRMETNDSRGQKCKVMTYTNRKGMKRRRKSARQMNAI